jgi:hypothetical protein
MHWKFWGVHAIVPACMAVLGGLLLVDIVFIAISSVQDAQGLPHGRWHVSYDNGLAERWQYVKWGLLALTFGVMAVRTASAVLMGWAALFLYLLLDDRLQIHEIVGQRLADAFGFPAAFGLRPQDFGELLVTGVAASVLLGVIAVAYLSTRSEDLRAVTHGLIALLLLLAVFGVGVDMLDIALPWERVRTILTVVEDGGEMIVASMMVAYALNWSLHLHRQRTVLA